MNREIYGYFTHSGMATSGAHAAVHALSAPPPKLNEDLALVASLSVDHLQAFCGAARELLRAPEDASMFRKAARQLGVEAGAVEAAVRALCFVMVGAVAAGRSPEDLLKGVDLVLPDESTAAIVAFFGEVAPQLERVCDGHGEPKYTDVSLGPGPHTHQPRLSRVWQELRSSLDLPRFQGLDWRLQVQLGGRYLPRRAPQPNFLLRLRTGGGTVGTAETLLQTDLPNMRHLLSELECALREDKSTHSRRIGRRL